MVSGAPAGGPGRGARAVAGRAGPAILPRPVRLLFPCLAAHPLRRREAVDGPPRRGPHDPRGRSPPGARLRARRRRDQRLQRPAAGLLLRRRLAASAEAPAAALGRGGGRAPARRGRPDQERGRAPGAVGLDPGRVPGAWTGRAEFRSPPVGAPVETLRSGRRNHGRGFDPAVRLALGDPRPVPELPTHCRLERPLARSGPAPPAPPAADLARAHGLGSLLVRRAAGPPRRRARPAAPRCAGPGSGGRGAAGDRLDRLLDQPRARQHRQDELEPFPAPGLDPAPGPLRRCTGRLAPPRFLVAFSLGKTRQISVSASR